MPSVWLWDAPPQCERVVICRPAGLMKFSLRILESHGPSSSMSQILERLDETSSFSRMLVSTEGAQAFLPHPKENLCAALEVLPLTDALSLY